MKGWGSGEPDSVWQNYFGKHLHSKGTVLWRTVFGVHVYATEAEHSEKKREKLFPSTEIV